MVKQELQLAKKRNWSVNLYYLLPEMLWKKEMDLVLRHEALVFGHSLLTGWCLSAPAHYEKKEHNRVEEV